MGGPSHAVPSLHQQGGTDLLNATKKWLDSSSKYQRCDIRYLKTLEQVTDREKDDRASRNRRQILSR